MNIKKITDAEVEAASVKRLASRPNETSPGGARGLTAEELKDAFDALGRLNASKFNELADELSSGLTDGSFSRMMYHGGTPIASQIDSITEKIATAEDFFMPITGMSFRYNTLLYPVSSFSCRYSGGVITVAAGSAVYKNAPIVARLGSFTMTKGRTYYVRLKEQIPAYFSANSDHITDGGRLRIQLDYGSNGSEDDVAKLNNFGNSAKKIRYTSEAVIFEAAENGTAHITISVYNNTGALTMPWQSSSITLTPEVFFSTPFPTKEDGDAFILALDKNYKASWFRFTSFNGNLSNTYTKSEIDKKINDLTAAVLALGGNV